MSLIGTVGVGDRITVEREWINPILAQTQAKLRVYYRQAGGTAQYWNGSAFTGTLSEFNMTQNGSKWYYIFTVPVEALGQELILEALIDEEHPLPESHRVITSTVTGGGTPTAEFS